jgi:hypothetical protein
VADAVNHPTALTAADLERQDKLSEHELAMQAAANCINNVIRALPEGEHLLIAPNVLRCWLALRKHEPQLFLLLRAKVKAVCGRVVVDLITDEMALVDGARTPLRGYSVAEILQRPHPIELVEGLIAAGIVLVYGESGCGKSFAAGDLAGAVVRGAGFLGHPVLQPGPVAYVAAEGNVRDRLAGYLAANALTVQALKDLQIIEPGIDLRGGADELVELLRAIQPSLLVIDTLNACMPGADENGSQDMSLALASVRHIRSEIGCTVVLIHHSGKDATRGARGHSSLRAAVDTELFIEAEEATGIRRLRVTKQRDGPTGLELAFRLAPIPLKGGSSSCVLEQIESPPQRQGKAAKLPDGVIVALDALKQAIAEHGEPLPATSTLPAGKRAVREETWRQCYYAVRPVAGSLETAEQRREIKARLEAFRRAKETLQGRRTAGSTGGFWWIW